MAQETFLKDRIKRCREKNILYPALRSTQKLHLQKIRMMLGCWAHFIISVECIKRIGMRFMEYYVRNQLSRLVESNYDKFTPVEKNKLLIFYS